MIWQEEKNIVDKIIKKIKPFSDSAKKYKINDDERLFIEALVSEMIMRDQEKYLNIDRRSNGLLNFCYQRAQIGRINLRSNPTRMQLIFPDDVVWLERVSVYDCINKLPMWVQRIDDIKMRR